MTPQDAAPTNVLPPQFHTFHQEKNKRKVRHGTYHTRRYTWTERSALSVGILRHPRQGSARVVALRLCAGVRQVREPYRVRSPPKTPPHTDHSSAIQATVRRMPRRLTKAWQFGLSRYSSTPLSSASSLAFDCAVLCALPDPARYAGDRVRPWRRAAYIDHIGSLLPLLYTARGA